MDHTHHRKDDWPFFFSQRITFAHLKEAAPPSDNTLFRHKIPLLFCSHLISQHLASEWKGYWQWFERATKFPCAEMPCFLNLLFPSAAGRYLLLLKGWVFCSDDLQNRASLFATDVYIVPSCSPVRSSTLPTPFLLTNYSIVSIISNNVYIASKSIKKEPVSLAITLSLFRCLWHSRNVVFGS